MGTSRAQTFQDVHPDFIALWKEGFHLLEIAADLGLSLSAIYAHALRAYQESITPPGVIRRDSRKKSAENCERLLPRLF